MAIYVAAVTALYHTFLPQHILEREWPNVETQAHGENARRCNQPGQARLLARNYIKAT
jgi:hypothetical protein